MLNVFIGLSMSNIDISAHFGGFIAGAILGLFFHNYKIIRKKKNSSVLNKAEEFFFLPSKLRINTIY